MQFLRLGSCDLLLDLNSFRPRIGLTLCWDTDLVGIKPSFYRAKFAARAITPDTLRSSGRRVFLAANSLCAYTHAVMASLSRDALGC